jgi:hypothetical protein
MTIGAASPLWFLFAGAAATGAAYWWMSQWVKPVNLEALMGEATKAIPAPPALAEERSFAAEEEPPALQAMVEPAFAAPVAPVEAVTEAVVEVQGEAEKIAETVAETATEALEATAEAAQASVNDTSEAIEDAAKAVAAPKAKAKSRAPIVPDAEV